jgi:uncharacterized glyoxalase superfamily protein PhnB
VPAVTPVLRYRDPRRAVDFLVEAFGFDGMVMIGPERSDAFGGRAGNGWTYVVVEGNL